MSQILPKYASDTLMKISGQNFDGSGGDYYLVVLGANSSAAVMDEGWISLTSGWAYARVPHGNPPASGSLWNPLRWPWLIGDGVRAGVSGYTAEDYVILTIENDGSQRVVFGATAAGTAVSVGKYQSNGGIIDVDPRTRYLESSAGQIVVTALTQMPPAVSDLFHTIRSRAEDLIGT